MIVLRLLFLAGLGLCVYETFSHAYWEASLRIPGRDVTYLVDIPRAPAWNPPPPPSYARFRRDFNDLPQAEPSGAKIARYHKLEWTLIDGSLYLWGVAVVTAIGYGFARVVGRRDVVLHVVARVAIALTIAALACLALWIIGGGWGPPMPLFFAIVGLSGGIVWGMLSWAAISRCERVPTFPPSPDANESLTG
jgi:hypothetical protein